MPNDIKYRCYHFSIKTVRFLQAKKRDSFGLIVAKQVMRSAMSVGANIVEAQYSSSRVEFKRFYEIALRSSAETTYWLYILRDGFYCRGDVFESTEISKILGASVLSIKKRNQ